MFSNNVNNNDNIIMAGSRLEKLGSIFTRIQGLLRSGALKYEDKPLWYEIYKRFPPKISPVFEREVPKKPVPTLLYQEDLVRARFFNEFGHRHDLVNLADDNKTQLVSERFVRKYNEIKTGNINDDVAFSKARDALKTEGVALKTFEEIGKEEAEKLKEELKLKSSVEKDMGRYSTSREKDTKRTFSAKDLFGDSVKRSSDEEGAFLDQEFFDSEAEELLKESDTSRSYNLKSAKSKPSK